MRDIATALEAVVVFDHRFAEAGMLAEHLQNGRAPGVENARLVLNHAARTAGRYAVDPSPDDAVAQPSPPAPGLQGPTTVRLVSTPADLASAQMQVRALLQTRWPFSRHISADAIRHVASSQLYLCRSFADIARASPRSTPLAEVFAQRADALAELVPHLTYLVDRHRLPQNTPLFWQQTELTSAVQRFRRGPAPRLAPGQVLELARSTHEVVSTFQRVLHRELTYLPKATALRIRRPAEHEQRAEVTQRVIGRDEPVVDRTAALGRLQWTDVPVARFSAPVQRAALTHALDVTPHASKQPPLFAPAREQLQSRSTSR